MTLSSAPTSAMGAVRRICCIGAGYVGGQTMAVIADRCPDLRCSGGSQRAAHRCGTQRFRNAVYEPDWML